MRMFFFLFPSSASFKLRTITLNRNTIEITDISLSQVRETLSFHSIQVLEQIMYFINYLFFIIHCGKICQLHLHILLKSISRWFLRNERRKVMAYLYEVITSIWASQNQVALCNVNVAHPYICAGSVADFVCNQLVSLQTAK